MEQQNNVTVHGGIHGRNNKIDNRSYQIKHVSTGSGRKGGESDRALLAAAFIVTVVSAFIYLRHHDDIFFWLKLGVIVAGACHLAAFVPMWRDSSLSYVDTWPVAVGVLLTVSQGVILLTAMDALPTVVFEIANRPTVATDLVGKSLEVWRRFNSHGHRLIISNMTTVLLIAPSIVLNIAFALQHFLQSVARAEEDEHCYTVAGWLHPFRVRGSVVSVAFMVLAAIVLSGVFQ